MGTSRVIPRFHRYAPGLDIDGSLCGLHAVDTSSGKILGSLVWPFGNQIFGLDWTPVEMTSGFPFDDGKTEPIRTDEKTVLRLFYDNSEVSSA